MMKEEEANQSQAAILEAKTDIMKTLLLRAEDEAKNPGDKPSFK